MKRNGKNVWFDVLIAVVMKTYVFWVIISCHLLKVSWRLEEYIASIFMVEE
jgi:hypothetical protein